MPSLRGIRRVLEAHVDADHVARHVERSTQIHAVAGPAFAVGMQAVIHVQRAQAACAGSGELRQHMQQGGGIRSAAEADAEGGGRRGGQHA